jgi:hypothetical protein
VISCPLLVFRRRSCLHSLHFRVMSVPMYQVWSNAAFCLNHQSPSKRILLEKGIYGQRGLYVDKACIV